MTELFALIDRFQALKNKTGTHKSSSYEINFHFSPWNEDVSISWGCYDIGNYPRHYTTTTTRSDLLTHMESEIDKMEVTILEDLANRDDS